MTHRLVWVAGLAVVLMAGIAVTWTRHRVAAPGSSAPLVTRVVAEPAAPTMSPPQASGPAVAAPSTAAAAGLPRVWDLCGIGTVPVPPGIAASAAADMVLPAHLDAMPTSELVERTMAALRQGTLRQRAAVLLLDADPEKADAHEARLAELALSARDPVLLSWAWSRCQPGRPCGASLARAWTAVEPANAAAWLALEQSEPARAAEVRAGLVEARHFSLRWGSLTHEFMQAVPTDAQPYLRLRLAEFVSGFDTALRIPSVMPLTRLCMPVPKAGSERQARCSAAAEMAVDRSDSLLGYLVGARLAQRAGWPAPRLAELRAERKRIEAVSADLPVDREQPLSCASVARFMGFIDERATHGELGHLRRRAALPERR